MGRFSLFQNTMASLSESQNMNGLQPLMGNFGIRISVINEENCRPIMSTLIVGNNMVSELVEGWCYHLKRRKHLNLSNVAFVVICSLHFFRFNR